MGKTGVQIHRISPYSKKNIILFFTEKAGKITLVGNSINFRFRSTVSQLRSNSPEFRFVANKQDMKSVIQMLRYSGLYEKLTDKKPFVINQFYKGGLTKDEQQNVLDETVYGGN